jgi:long-chain acyl-CoA synthetase
MPKPLKEPWSFLDRYRVENAEPVRLTTRWPSLHDLFRITAHRFPERPAFTAFEPDLLQLTYAEALGKIEKTAAYLIELGVKPGDTVGVTGKNSPEWAVAYLSILFAGAIVVPIDYGLKDEEISNLLKFSGAQVLFIDNEREPVFSSVVARTISLTPDGSPYILSLEPAGPFSGVKRSPSECAAILYTSGTTGDAKGVMLSHENLTSDCLIAQCNLYIDHTDVFYALLPIHHSYTMLAVFIEAVSTGAEIVFAKRMALKQILSDLKQGEVTMLLGIPMLFNKLLKGIKRGIREKGIVVYGVVRFLMITSGLMKKITGRNPGKRIFHGILSKASLESIRICISGGGPLPSETFRQFNQLGIDFVQGYGLTETSPIIALNPVHHYKEESVGKVLPETVMKIREPDEKGRGEIIVKGPMVMQGYYRNDAATKEVFTEDGYLLTGDVGYLDRENYLYLTGRKKSLIVTEGGKNVYPEEIEHHFELYDEIDQIMVKGYIADERMKIEQIEAYIHPDTAFFEQQNLTPDADVDAIESRIREIVSEVNKHLHSYQKVQRSTVLWEPMETTTTRKIKRHVVEQQIAEEVSNPEQHDL